MNVVNLTPHAIAVEIGDGRVNFAPSGIIARVATIQETVGDVNGIPIVTTRFGDVTGLPDPQPDTVFIASSLVAQRAQRRDVVSPDTGPTAIRKNGQIVAVRGLQVF